MESLQSFLKRFHENPAVVMDELPEKELSITSSKFTNENLKTKNYLFEKDNSRKQLIRGTKGNAIVPFAPIVEFNDDPSALVDNGLQLIGNIHQIDQQQLIQASLTTQPWSDTYWPLYKGALADRYADPLLAEINADGFEERYLFSTTNQLPQSYIDNQTTAFLSPAEKYDLLVGDGNYSLTENMWQSGKKYFDRNGSVERWMGLCHGWAPAAYMLPRPQKSLQLKSVSGQNITFFPSDIKALGTLLWANASPDVRFIGGRCNVKSPEKDVNGRITDTGCFDTNPGSWHQAVVNQIGISKRSFVIDATFDYEVWNQPVLSYQYSYFNPQTGVEYSTAEEAKIALIEYERDKFKSYRGASSEFVVGVNMRLTYLVETQPSHRTNDLPRYDHRQTVRYTYDLELDQDGNILGGEWYQNAHPDFLWTPAADARAISRFNPEQSTLGNVVTQTEQGVLAQGDWQYFGPIKHAGGKLKVTVSGDGDADLYVNQESQPNETRYQCRPYLNGSNEHCELNRAGDYFIALHGYGEKSNFELSIDYIKATEPEVVTHQARLVEKEWKYFGPFELTDSVMDIVMTGSGDADLYLAKNNRPDLENYICRPYKEGSEETCRVSENGIYYIGIQGYSEESTIELKVIRKPFEGDWKPGRAIPELWQDNAKKASTYGHPLTAIVEQIFDWSSQ